MSAINLTPSQQDAVSARSGNVLVSAAAGSGKTAVLVQRIIDAITDEENPVSIDRMLIVTFTRAATLEMRSRIENAINDLLRADPYNKYLLSQKHLLYSARISTIDSFCAEFVRRYFYKLDIQRDFNIPDTGEENILINKALDNTLEFFYKQNDRRFLNLVAAVCSHRNDDNLKKYILQIYRFISAFPFPENRLDEMLGFYKTCSAGFEDTPYFDYIMNYARECLFYCLELNSVCFSYLDRDTILETDKLDKIRDVLKDDFTTLNRINADAVSGDWDGLLSDIDEYKQKRFPAIKGADDDKYKELIKNTRGSYKDEIKSLKSIFISDIDTINSETEKIFPIIKALFDCVKRFESEFNALKTDKNLLTYSDIEHLTVKLLCDNMDGEISFTDISEEISREFDLIMVDEFQDINDTQNLIFRAVSRDRNNLFVVGDVKQSIYGFRQAKPDIFIDYKNRYRLYDRENPEYPAKIILDRNFRSRKGVIEACNFVFSTLMSEEIGGIEYSDEEKLVYGATYPASSAVNMELMFIDTAEINKEEDEKKEAFEAARVAEKIYKLMYEEKLQVKDGDSTRPVTYGDIAVLLRSAKGDTRRAVTFANTFKEYGIPVISSEKNNFFEENEIKIMLNFLRVIDNPVQDIPILSVLMSPMFGFTSDDMARIRAEYRRMPIYNAVKQSADNDDKCLDFITFLTRMRSLAVTTPVDRLIGIILSETGFGSIVTAAENMTSRNLYLLREFARKYAGSGYKTLTAFINYVDRMSENGTIINSGDEPGVDNLNAVRIMSIHASKGLEFPVCFLSSTSTKFNLQDTTSDLVISDAGGVGIRYLDNIIKYDTIQRKAVGMMMSDAQLSEEMRVLYVALTRARERLIITSAQQNPESYLSRLESRITSYPISPYVIKRSRSFSDWIFTAALANPSCKLRHEIEPDYTNYSEDYRPWHVSVVGKSSEFEDFDEGDIVTEQTAVSSVNPDTGVIRKFLERLNFEYKNKPIVSLPTKVSASELSHRDNGIFNKLLLRPVFLTEKKSSGAQKGTAFHAFMEHCDIIKAKDNLKSEAERLVSDGFLSDKDIELLDFKALNEFFNSSLISRVINSGEYFREYTFTVKINASDYDPDIPDDFKENKIIMQGAVDLAFIENGEIVLVDYKTDRVKDIEKLAVMYRKQVELYKNALEETMNKRVKEIIIYSVHLNKELKV
ncbi:MAG: helicase-exonuclease AddAB subunit AddA [Ruminococcus sp.]|nr:helicase-exonuclease AddAB subunit AddA [Ruminococcus sp.]